MKIKTSKKKTDTSRAELTVSRHINIDDWIREKKDATPFDGAACESLNPKSLGAFAPLRVFSESRTARSSYSDREKGSLGKSTKGGVKREGEEERGFSFPIGEEGERKSRRLLVVEQEKKNLDSIDAVERARVVQRESLNETSYLCFPVQASRGCKTRQSVRRTKKMGVNVQGW